MRAPRAHASDRLSGTWLEVDDGARLVPPARAEQRDVDAAAPDRPLAVSPGVDDGAVRHAQDPHRTISLVGDEDLQAYLGAIRPWPAACRHGMMEVLSSYPAELEPRP